MYADLVIKLNVGNSSKPLLIPVSVPRNLTDSAYIDFSRTIRRVEDLMQKLLAARTKSRSLTLAVKIHNVLANFESSYPNCRTLILHTVNLCEDIESLYKEKYQTA